MAAVLILNTPDDRRLRPKHVEWLCRNKTCTVLHQVGISFDSNIALNINTANWGTNTLLNKQLWGKVPNVSKLRQLKLQYRHIPVFTTKPSNCQMLHKLHFYKYQHDNRVRFKAITCIYIYIYTHYLCVCIYIYTHTHTHTHTFKFIRNDCQGFNNLSYTMHLK